MAFTRKYLKSVDSSSTTAVTGIRLGSNTATLQTGEVTVTPGNIGAATSNHTHSDYASSSHTHSQYALTSHTHSGYASSSHTHTASQITSGLYYPHYNLAVQLTQLSGSSGRLKIYKTPCAGYLLITPTRGYTQSADGDVFFAVGTQAALEEETGNTQASNRIIVVGIVSSGIESFGAISPLIGPNVYFRNVNGAGADYTKYNYWFIPAISTTIYESSFNIITRTTVFSREKDFTGTPKLLGSL